MTRLGRKIGLLALFPLFAAATPQTSAPAPGSATSRVVTCAFSNPGYSGWCRVTENVPAASTPLKVCRSVLACLNDVRCVKTYCNATQIRINWKLETVKSEGKRK